MGNSHSNKKRVIDGLGENVDGIPIWPPIQRNLQPYDVVKVGRDGSVEHVGGGLRLQQLISKDAWNDVDTQLKIHTTMDSGFSFNGDSENMLELKTAFLESVELGLSANASKDISIKINDREINTLKPADGSAQQLQTIANALFGQDFNTKMYNVDKYIYVVTEVTDTKGFTLSSSEGSEYGGNIKIMQEKIDATIGHKSSSGFETQGQVSISFKALRFKVKEDKITKTKFVSQSFNRNGVIESKEETLASKCFENEQLDHHSGNPSSLPRAKTKWALLIGNNDYSESGMTSLGGCENDVDDIDKFLQKRKFDKANIDKNKNLTYAETVEKMESFINQTRFETDDLLVFYYAGHGSERRSNNDNDIKKYEQTIVPVDSFHDEGGSNRDISRDMLQGWVKELGCKGVRTMLFFDSCHSGGVIRGDDIPEESRAVRGDKRPASQQDRPSTPSWILTSEKDRGIIEENAIFFAACKSYQYAREIQLSNGRKNGALTSKLISILEQENQATFVQLVDQLGRQLMNQKQTPGISGNVDTVAFCIDNLILKSPLPYTNIDIKPKGNDVSFDLPLMLPYVTKGSEYILFETSDVYMDHVVGKFTVDRVINNSEATVKFSEIYNGFGEKKLEVKNEAKRLRAVEILHNPATDDKQEYYTNVFVQDDFELAKLQYILSNLKAEMYLHRNKFPVEDLPRSCFIKIVEEESLADMIVSYSEDDESSSSQASYISMKNSNGELLLPKVLIDAKRGLQDGETKTSEGEVRLVASYIASHAHWNMVQRLENKSTQLSDAVIKVNVFNQHDKIVEKNSEGYYDMDWDYGNDATEEFSFKFELDSKEDYLLNIVSLDVDYGVYNYEYEEQDEKRSQSKSYDQYCSDIMKKYKGTQKWCNPLSEWKFFISTVRNNHDNNDEKGRLDQAMGSIESKCLKPSNYSKYVYDDKSEDTWLFRDKARAKKERPKTNDWTCISVKLKFSEFYDEYGRVPSSGLERGK